MKIKAAIVACSNALDERARDKIENVQQVLAKLNTETICSEYLYVKEDEYTLLAVADGMGGHNAGDVASSMLIDEILKYNLKR